MSSSFKPDIHTQNLLRKGLKFISTPKPIKDKAILQDFSEFKRRLTVKALIQEEVEKGNPHFTNHQLPPKFLFGASSFIPPKPKHSSNIF